MVLILFVLGAIVKVRAGPSHQEQIQGAEIDIPCVVEQVAMVRVRSTDQTGAQVFYNPFNAMERTQISSLILMK